MAAKFVTMQVMPLGLVTRAGLDVVMSIMLIGWFQWRRRPAPGVALVLTVLNIGLFVAMNAISAGSFPAGVGFGLFGILSLVRLRSAAFTLRDVAYTFAAMVLALCNGLPQRETWLIVALDVLLLAAVLMVDNPRSHRPVHLMKLTLDRLYAGPHELRRDIERRFGQQPLAVIVDEIDYVRETTRVVVGFPDGGEVLSQEDLSALGAEFAGRPS